MIGYRDKVRRLANGSVSLAASDSRPISHTRWHRSMPLKNTIAPQQGPARLWKPWPVPWLQ